MELYSIASMGIFSIEAIDLFLIESIVALPY
jgi:hypothetical protein